MDPLLRLEPLLDSWALALRAERKAAGTIVSYTIGVRLFLAWCQEQDVPAVLDRSTASGFLADLLDRGKEATTVKTRHLALRLFAKWLAAEGELDQDPLAGLKPPKLDLKIIEPLTADEVRAMIAACSGKGLVARRDEAIIRFMFETTARAGEVVSQTVSDMNLHQGLAVIRRGKGGKGRIVPFGPQTGRAIDRYLRLRREHPLAATDMLWLGLRGNKCGYYALWRTLHRRADAAGVVGFHPHRLRHTAAHRWLAAGGSETGLMAIAGWERPDMLRRYTRARESARAAEEARKLNLGDL